MKLKFFFFILSLLLVAVWGVLLVLSFKERGMLFYICLLYTSPSPRD